MSYYINKTIESDFDAAIQKVSEDLQKIGFGVLTRIDVHDKFKEALDVDFNKYTILGACNPAFAYQAMQVDDKIGTLLPCNVIVQDKGNGFVEVSAVDPQASMMAVKNGALEPFAVHVKEMLEKFISEL